MRKKMKKKKKKKEKKRRKRKEKKKNMKSLCMSPFLAALQLYLKRKKVFSFIKKDG